MRLSHGTTIKCPYRKKKMINKEELNALTRRRAYNQGIVDGVEALREEDLLEGGVQSPVYLDALRDLQNFQELTALQKTYLYIASY